MRLIKSLFFVTLLSIFAFADDNQENKEALENLYEKVILKDVDKALNDVETLKEALKNKNEKDVKKSFIALIKSWKSVETLYILGDLNEDFIDTPRYIDIFHNSNEDITKQLDRAIKSEDEAKIALFKNSLKSINALEYVVYKKDIKNKRVNEIAFAIVSKIGELLKEINEEYKLQEKNFLNDLQKANSFTINAIIQNTYKLKEWRIGDVIGATKKYEDKPNNSRAEYYLSKNSAVAIEAVLNTLKNVFDNKDFKDYGDYLLEITNGEQVHSLRDSINKSLELVKKIKNDDFSNAQELYEEVSNIHIVLFLEIIEELSINAKIIEADGD